MKKLFGMKSEGFKLYQPVIVEEVIDGIACRYVGEVLSLRTLEGTYMVRRVPRHPGTLLEVKESQLSDPLTTARTLWIHYAAVRDVLGSAPIVDLFRAFPVDMLRYDCAAPVNFKLEEYGSGVHAVLLEDFLTEKRLLIACTSVKKIPQWTDRRWQSFGWSIDWLHSEEWEVGRG